MFGAFQNLMDVQNLLEIFPNCCFYEVIRESRACKAYFDMEAEPGIWTEQQGRDKCQLVVKMLENQVQHQWPACLAHMILEGSVAELAERQPSSGVTWDRRGFDPYLLRPQGVAVDLWPCFGSRTVWLINKSAGQPQFLEGSSMTETG
jgi:hypothetical protein